MPAIISKRPLYDDDWEAKLIQVERISNISIFLTVSYSTMLHSYGSFQTFITAKLGSNGFESAPFKSGMAFTN